MVKSNEKLQLLQLLHGQCSTPVKKKVVDFLLKKLKPANARFICHAALELGALKDVKHAIFQAPETVMFGLWQGLEERLVNESEVFTDEDVELIAEMRKQLAPRFRLGRVTAPMLLPRAPRELSEILERVAKEIDEIRYFRLERELLSGTNPEINTDKKLLLSRMETLGFRPEIARALEEADRELSTAATPFEFKGVVDLVRTAYEETLEDAARRVARLKDSPITGTSHFAAFREFLVKQGIVTKDEGELSQKLYNYLSNAGVHALGSAPEQARVTKNIVIEICLLILGRIQNVEL